MESTSDSTASPAQRLRPQAAQGTEAKRLSGTEASQTNANDAAPFPEKTVATAAGETSNATPAEKAPTPSGIVSTESARRMRTPAPHPTATADPFAAAKDSGSLPNDVTMSTRSHDDTPADIGATDVTATTHESAPARRALQSQPTTGRTERRRPPVEAGCDDKATEANETQGDNAAQSATTRDDNPAEIDAPRSAETAHVSRPPASAAQAPISPSRHDGPQLSANGESGSDTSSPDTTQATDRAAATGARERISAHSASKVGTAGDTSESSAGEHSQPSVSGISANERNTAQALPTTEEGNDAEASHDSALTSDAERWRARVMERVSGEFADAIERHGENAGDRSRYYRDLLEALAADEPIDPAAIAARSVHEEATVAGVPNVEPSSPDSGRPEILHDRSWIEGLLSTDSSALQLVVTPLLADPASAAEAVALWPTDLLERIFARLRPAEFGMLRPYAATMTSACNWDDAATRNRRMWCFLAETLFPAPRYAAAPDFVAAYADRIATEAPSMGDFRAALCAALPEGTNADRPTQYIRYWLLGASRKARRTDAPTSTQTGIAIDNAGLVILSPYLPRLFETLGMLQEGHFSSPAQTRRACHLLQFTVDERSDVAEHELALNKLLCGFDLRQPLDAGITLEEHEKSTIEGMLTACISHWGALGKASPAGLRETFLQRPGQLTFNAEAWRLKVEKKTLDILMERLPWSFSIIRHPWMTQPVFVEWL
jgi:hypothetical protein